MRLIRCQYLQLLFLKTVIIQLLVCCKSTKSCDSESITPQWSGLGQTIGVHVLQHLKMDQTTDYWPNTIIRHLHTARHGNTLLTGLNYVAITSQWSGLGLTMMTSSCNRCLAVYKLVVGTQLGMVTIY